MTTLQNNQHDIRKARGKFLAMAATYCLGVFNDNYFKQAAMLLAVAAGMSRLQGWATMLFALPFILFSAYGGWCADRFPKRRVVILSKALELVAMLAGGAGLLSGNWYLILSMVFLMGLQSTFFSPALNGAIPELYPVDYVPQANAALKLVTTLAILAGVATAGISLDQHWFSADSVPFGIMLVATVAVLVAFIGFLASFGVGSRPAASPDKAFPWFGPWNSALDLLDICRDREMLLAIFSDSYFYFLASITLLSVNTFGLQQLGFSQTATSLLSMCMMLGVCGGSFLAARLVTMDNWSALLVRSSLGMAAGLSLAGATVWLPSLLRFWWLAATLIATGVAGGLFLIPVASLQQVRPPETEKGRVLAAAGFSSFIAILIAGLLFDLCISHLTPATLMTGLGLFAAAISIGIRQLRAPSPKPFARLFSRIMKMTLSLRYHVEIKGLDAIEDRPGRPILFLPNHPALIDPVIVMSALYGRFAPRPLADEDQLKGPVVRAIMKYVRPITMPDVGKVGRSGKERVRAAIDEVVGCLEHGEHVLFYPAGRLNRSAAEDLGGNSGVEFIADKVPDLRVVLVRTIGLWGSSFSRAAGTAPSLTGELRRHLLALLANGLFFMPRRKVTLECVEDDTVAGLGDRSHINRYLESFYNCEIPARTHVPYYRWQGSRAQVLPEPVRTAPRGRIDDIAQTTKELVYARVKEMAGVEVSDDQRLAADLGLDSLSLLELCSWLEGEFGITISESAQPESVGDCVLAAGGMMTGTGEVQVDTPPATWHSSTKHELVLASEKTVTACFLRQARTAPRRIIAADQVSGARSYRDLLTAIFALLPEVEKIPGERVGIMLPASVSSLIAYLTVLFAGKTPVLFNWTSGFANMAHGIEDTGVECIISARALCSRVEQQGTQLTDLSVAWLYLDEFFPGLSRGRKLLALASATLLPGRLARRKATQTAAVLFTSGSEAKPKAVPLSHANILANLADFSGLLRLTGDSRLLGMLPPFHSLGLVGTMIMPLCLGLPTVYHPNPMEPATLAALIEAYKVSMLVATPTFLDGILQVASRDQLSHLRLVFAGAEKCPDHVLAGLRASNPQAELCEGYGITECSPLVSINTPGSAIPGTIGKILPSIEYAIVDIDTGVAVADGKQGLLLVRGPSIFAGYLGDKSGLGFCEFEGKCWYQTGDFVRKMADGHLVFCGRQKRFVKIGGEMISLPAIEQVLLQRLNSSAQEEGPQLAVEATADDGHPELVLFTTSQLKRDEVNGHLRAAGLSGLHHIRRLHQLESIPVLGSGKTDYRRLKQLLAA